MQAKVRACSVLVLVFVSSSATTNLQVYNEWIARRGVKLHNGVKLVERRDEFGELLVTVEVPRGIPAGEPLVSVPDTAVLSAQRWVNGTEGQSIVSRLRAAAAGHPFVTSDSSFNNFMLAVAAARDPQSAWNGLTSVISEGHQPLWWAEEDLEQIRGTMLYKATKESTDELEACADMMCAALRDSGLGGTCQDLRRARTAALEHAFVMEGDLLLVPIVHLAKKRLATRGLSPALERTQQGFVWLSSPDGGEEGLGIVEAAQVTMDQLQLLWHFGMVLPGNPKGVVHKVFRGRQSLLRHIEANRGGVGSEWMSKYQRALDKIGDNHKLTLQDQPLTYVMAVRLLMCEMKGLDCSHLFSRQVANEGRQQLVDPHDEAAVWSAAAQGLKSHLRRLQGGTAADDLALSRQKGMHRHRVVGLLYRRSEKQILEAHVAFCEAHAMPGARGGAAAVAEPAS